MAASKRTPNRPVERRNRASVPQSGSRASTRTSVARSKPVTRTAPQKRGAPAKVLPAVQSRLAAMGETPTKQLPTPIPSDRYPYVDPTIIKAAFARARAAIDAGHYVEWDRDKQHWTVPSATRSGRSYRVWKRRGRHGRLPFWVALECNCQAEQSGTYLVCWHKCAVKIRWDEELELRAMLRRDIDELQPDGPYGEEDAEEDE